MKNIIVIVGLCVLYSLVQAARVSSQKLATGDPAIVETASVEGLVTRAGSEVPVRAVLVTFTPESGSPRSIVTGDDGRFEAKELRPGRYAISIGRAGYFPARPDGADNLTLAAGDIRKGIRFELWAAAAISGKIVDQDGQPLKSVAVSRVCRQYDGGRQVLSLCGANPQQGVDANGSYRLDNLQPGEYYIAASTPGVGSMEIAYYPGVSDPGSAIPIVLVDGMEAAGMDFRVPRQERYLVSFKIVEPQEESVRAGKGETLQIRRRGDAVTMLFPVVRSLGQVGLLVALGEGRYRLREGLPAGSYDIDYSRGSSVNIDMTGRLSINVEDADLDAGTMVLKHGVTIYGRLDGTGTLPPDWDKEWGLRLSPADGRVFSPLFASLDADGKFVIGRSDRTPSGEKRVTPTPVSYGRYQVELRRGISNDKEALNKQGLCLTEVTYGGLSVLDGGFVVDGEPTGPLVVTVGRGGTLEGQVEDSQEHPIAHGRVVVIPAPDRRGGPNLFRTEATDQYGRFAIMAVVPGEYGVVAFQKIEQGAWLNPKFLAEMAGRAVKVTVQSGLHTSANVHVIGGSN